MVSIILPDPPLSDGTITLRPFTEDDIADVTRACQDAEIARWTATIPSPYSQEHARSWIAEHDRMRADGVEAPFAVVAADDGRLQGSIGAHAIDRGDGRAEIGYWTAPWARRQGVATRATVLLSAWAINELGLHRLELLTFIGNEGSERVAASAGFTREGVLRRYLEVRGSRVDVTVWSLLPADLERS